MMIELPYFGQDVARVAGYTEPSHDVYSRIFSPLMLAGGKPLKWSRASALVGVQLLATTRWDELELASHGHAIDIGGPQQGTVDKSTVDAVIQVVGHKVRSERAYFALWQGYAGELNPQLERESVLIPPHGENYLCDGSFRLFSAELVWARTRCYERRYHFPVAVWPEDRAFTLATALYQDSYYMSSDREVLALLQEAGVDALEISRDELLPSIGD